MGILLQKDPKVRKLGKPGRRCWRPTAKDRSLVQSLIRAGISHDEVAAVLKISRTTLTKHMQHEMKTGHLLAVAAVSDSVFKLATKGRPAHVKLQAGIFWLKARARWRDSDASGAFLATMRPLKEMSDDEFSALLQVNGMPPLDIADNVVPITGRRR
jgi:predicted ArsR family transcriptional regulator